MNASRLVPALGAVVAMALTCCTAPVGQDASIVDQRYARQPTCDGLRDSCIGGGRCCDGMFCGFDFACCVAAGQVCAHDGDCCSGHCHGGVCALSAPQGACDSDAECAAGLECNLTLATCYAKPGGYCRTSNDCGSNQCSGGQCVCGQGSSLCATDADCCSGFVCVGQMCRGNGGAGCGSDADCNAGCCIDGTCSGCGAPIGSGCTSDSDCGPGATCDPTTGTCL